MPKYQKRILVGVIASASLAALVAVLLRASQPPGNFQSDRGRTSWEKPLFESPANPGAPSLSPPTGVDSGSPGDSDAHNSLMPGSIRAGSSSPDGVRELGATRATLYSGAKDNEEKSRLLAQLADTSSTKRVDALRRLGIHVVHNPTDVETLRAIQIAASSDAADEIRTRALGILIRCTDTRSFEVVVERCLNDHSETVKWTAIACLRSVADPEYLVREGSPREDILPLVRERTIAARAALAAARIAADDAEMSAAIDEALRALEQQ